MMKKIVLLTALVAAMMTLAGCCSSGSCPFGGAKKVDACKCGAPKGSVACAAACKKPVELCRCGAPKGSETCKVACALDAM